MPANVEHDALIGSYEHLPSMPRAADALHTIRKIASLVKPIMRKHNWRVNILTEFYPHQQNLLGLNVNHGYKICLRLRYPSDQSLFLPIEQVVDTMLHELCHNDISPHNTAFHSLWDTLRDEYENLRSHGYSGEGFLGNGQRLGGRYVPIQEMRRQARAAAEARKVRTAGSGQRLGGAPVLWGTDIRQVIADAASRRMRITSGCASGERDAEAIAEEASQNGFRTKAEENDANERAIAQALWELVQEEEARKAGATDWRSEGLTWNPATGLQPAGVPPAPNEAEEMVKKGSKSSTSKLSKLSPPPPIPIHSKPAPASSAKSKSALSPLKRIIKRPKTEHVDLTAASPSSASKASQAAPPAPVPTTWSCPACTLVNPISATSCEVCENKRPSSTIPSANSTSTKPISRPSSRTSGKLNGAELSASRMLGSGLSNKSMTLISKEEAEARARVKQKLGWQCSRCGTWTETTFWSCMSCGNIKERS